MTEIWIRTYKVLKGLLKKVKNGRLNVGNLGTNYAKISASLKEMVNDKIELNFQVVITATNDLIPILTKLKKNRV